MENQVLESAIEVTQTQVEETDTDNDSNVPDLIDSQGNIRKLVKGGKWA